MPRLGGLCAAPSPPRLIAGLGVSFPVTLYFPRCDSFYLSRCSLIICCSVSVSLQTETQRRQRPFLIFALQLAVNKQLLSELFIYPVDVFNKHVRGVSGHCCKR